VKRRATHLVRVVAVAALAAIGLTFNIPGGAALAAESPDNAIRFDPATNIALVHERDTRGADGSKRPPGLAGLHPCARASPWRLV